MATEKKEVRDQLADGKKLTDEVRQRPAAPRSRSSRPASRPPTRRPAGHRQPACGRCLTGDDPLGHRLRPLIRHPASASIPATTGLLARPSTETHPTMAKARAIIKRRKSVQNIRKITRTMELIATARFRKALDRATQAEAYTRKIAEIVADLRTTSSEVAHPLLEEREPVERVLMLVLTSNRGLAGSYNGNVLRMATQQLRGAAGAGRRDHPGGLRQARDRLHAVPPDPDRHDLHPVRGPSAVRGGRGAGRTATSSQFLSGKIDRLEVVYTRFLSSARQVPVTETLLPMTVGQVGEEHRPAQAKAARRQGPEAAGRAGPLRIPARPGEHPGRDRPGVVQGPPLQVLPRRGRQRADHADDRHAGRRPRTPTRWSRP